MQRCPHCGAENSAKRTTCYSCEKDLGSRVIARRGETSRNSRAPVASRWQVIEPVTQKPPPRPLPDSITRSLEPQGALDAPGPQARLPQAAPGARPAPTPRSRNSMRHVRRMGLFYRQLHALVHSGINLASACREVELRAPTGFRGLAREMAAAAEAGRPISSVLEQHPSLIYPWHLGVLRAAEAAGSLPDALDQIATAYETEWETRAHVSLQMFIYCYLGVPLVLLIIPLFAVLQLPIPKDFWNPESFLHAYLQMAARITLPIAVAIVGFLLTWRVLSVVPWFQAVQQRLVLGIPLVGRLSRVAASERYLSTLAMSLQAGVSLTDSTTEAARAAGNPALTPRLLQVAPKVQAGVPLAQALTDARLFDGDTLRLAGTGEMTGTLPAMLDKAAEYVREQHVRQRKMLMRLVGVGMTLLFGVVVCYIVVWGARTYFDVLFRAAERMQE